MTTFVARRSYRGWLIVAGALWCAVIGGGGTVLATSHHLAHPTWFSIAGAGGFFVAMIASMIPRGVAIEVERGTLAIGGRTIRQATVEVGDWVAAGVDTSIGVAAHVRGDGGTVVLGAKGHMADGLRFRASPVRAVDADLQPADLDRVLDLLGIERGQSGPLVIGLVRSSQTFGGAFKMIAPWILTIAVIAAASVTTSISGLGEHLMNTSSGRIILNVGSIGVVAIGLVWSVVRAMRVRRPSLELRILERELLLARPDGTELARARSELRVVRHRYWPGDWVGKGLPVIVLGFPDRTIRIGCWSTTHPWDDDAPKGRSPTWLAGDAAWAKLVAALRARNALPSPPGAA